MLPLISDRTARNGLSVRPVRTSRPTRAVDLQSNDQSRPPMKALPEDPLRNLLRRHPLSGTFRSTLSEDPPPFESQPEDPLRNPSGRSPRKPLRKPPRSTPLSEAFGARRVSRNSFGAVAKPCRVPFRSLRRNLLRNLSKKATCPGSQPK